ncbi:hypothetical protein [Pseudoalteromonas denitrificans]|uniref:Uncharacterized protein n=1 Tax=Pseudoalteromonas denitrificans DSM 6059 TaxID=1123010 RepID=A0A1I1H0E9_9GAMM|nr:hypothetical protein [Pseudoalteromonas denitrificans]SFC17245.1 hypothetical protein SAMN02745724_01092 [Pseudoalteromonas denitrificans DSM 6059]
MKKRLYKNLTLLFAALFVASCAQEHNPDIQGSTHETQQLSQSLSVVQAVPQPFNMVANVITNARVSTLKHIDVAYVGKQIPFTFSHGKVKNTIGFEWYVSKHFALKTDYPAEKAKFFLELLELSYPYYVEFFGMEPANIDHQRIASTYATSNDTLTNAMFDDGFNRGIHHTAGGEAMYYNWVGYSFPTERPQHQRYIAIHETMHSYQMALGNYPWTPSWHGEGLGDATANHIFDSHKKQLTVFGHDVPIFDMVSWGLDTYQKEKPSIIDIHNRAQFDRGLNVLFVQFMFNNPEYSQYLKIYHQEVMRKQTDSRKSSLSILQSIVPDWQQLETDFATWASNINQSHDVASRGQWEINGNMFYKRKSHYDYAPQRLGFNITPAEKPEFKSFKIDFPSPKPSQLLLDIKRGIEEPTLGYEIEYQSESLQQGTIGMAFGTKSTEDNLIAKKHYRSWKGGNTDLDEQLRIEVKEAKTLMIDGRQFGSDLKQIPLPLNIINKLQQQVQPKLGVSIHIRKDALIVTIKTKETNAFEVKYTITSNQHNNLINRFFGLVSSDNQHGITPYIDDGRDLNPNMPDYMQTTAANAWGFKGDKLAHRFARANWKAGDKTPLSWKNAFNRLNQAALNKSVANSEIESIEAKLPHLISQGKGLSQAQVELSGIQLQVDWLGGNKNTLKEHAIITNNSKSPITGKIRFTVNGVTKQFDELVISGGDKRTIQIPEDLLNQGDYVEAKLEYIWQNTRLTQKITQKTKQYKGFELPKLSAEFHDGKLNIAANLNGPFAGKTQGIITFDLYYGSTKQTQEQDIKIAPYEEQQLVQSFKIDEESLDHDAWFEVTVIADSDGEPITLRKRLPYVPKRFKR